MGIGGQFAGSSWGNEMRRTVWWLECRPVLYTFRKVCRTVTSACNHYLYIHWMSQWCGSESDLVFVMSLASGWIDHWYFLGQDWISCFIYKYQHRCFCPDTCTHMVSVVPSNFILKGVSGDLYALKPRKWGFRIVFFNRIIFSSKVRISG